MKRSKNKLCSLRSACPLLDIAYNTALKLAKDGKLRTITVGSRLRISYEEITRFQKEGNYVPPPPNQPPPPSKPEAPSTIMSGEIIEGRPKPSSNLPSYLQKLQRG